MREIKFRGYLKKENKMFPVCDLNFNDVDRWAVGISSCGRLDCGLCEDYYERTDVEVMQYTGLKDKNGREIYEGDIVLLRNEFADWKGTVTFHEGAFKLSINRSWGDSLILFSKTDVFEDMGARTILNNTYEVIGNIYENPELLEEMQNESK